jgi:hypothetical protein
MEIRYVDYALANNFGSYVEINKALKGYPELHDAILKHELSHTDSKGFTKEDFLLDLAPSKISYWKLFKFMCIYPKAFFQFAPFYFQKIEDKRTFIYDINLCIVWSVFIGLLVATYIIF